PALERASVSWVDIHGAACTARVELPPRGKLWRTDEHPRQRLHGSTCRHPRPRPPPLAPGPKRPMQKSVRQTSDRCRRPGAQVAVSLDRPALRTRSFVPVFVLAMVGCATRPVQHVAPPPDCVSAEAAAGTTARDAPVSDHERESLPRAPQASTASGAGAGDADFSEVAYPFPVLYRSFQAQGLSLRMAYMDVSPPAGAHATVVLLHGKNFSGAYWEA